MLLMMRIEGKTVCSHQGPVACHSKVQRMQENFCVELLNLFNEKELLYVLYEFFLVI